jgi:hypothetical protein
MKKFSVSRDSFVWEFLQEMNIDFEDTFKAVYQRKFPEQTADQIEKFRFDHWDEIDDPIYNLSGYLYQEIEFLCSEDEEIEESSGTWGYAHFIIEEVESIRMEIQKLLERELEDIIDQILS